MLDYGFPFGVCFLIVEHGLWDGKMGGNMAQSHLVKISGIELSECASSSELLKSST